MNDLIYGINALNHRVDIITGHEFSKSNNSSENLCVLEEQLKKNVYDYVISHMFSIDVAEVCRSNGVRYISWIFDSPDPFLYTCEAEQNNNYIFIFDRAFYTRLKIERNIPNLFYLPLGACIPRINRINIAKEEMVKYSSDISFVGNLYEYNQFDKIRGALSENDLKMISEYVDENCCSWYKPRKWPRIPKECLNMLEEAGYFRTASSFEMDKSTYLGVAVMARKLAQIERVLLLDELGKYEDVRLYTKSDASMLKNVKVCPPVDYERDMSIVFNQSKINLNITIPSIESGLPQRVWDIIGSGGFCMTNYQPEIEEYFEIGTDIETFKDFDELKIKVRFYLEHEDLRLKILMNGYKKVIEKHTYMHRINEMIKLCIK